MTDRSTLETVAIICRSPKSFPTLCKIAGLSMEQIAEQARVELGIVEQIAGGNLSAISASDLFAVAHTIRIDPRDLDEYGDNDDLYYDPKDEMDGGKIGDRDKRYGLPDDFWIWIHRRVKPRNIPDDWKRMGREDFEDFYEDWKKLKCPVPKTFFLPK